LLEEYFKILRAGSAAKTFRMLAELGLLEPISGELHRGAAEPLWRALAALDAYRRRFESMPETLTNPILLGSLLVPLGISLGPGSGRARNRRLTRARDGGRGLQGSERSDGLSLENDARGPRDVGPLLQTVPKLGFLPLARRDVDRLRQILALQPRLLDVAATPRAQQGLVRRSLFHEALTWLEIHGGVPDVVDYWKAFVADASAEVEHQSTISPEPWPRRRRRRRRRRRPTGSPQS
jgi:hypothetical protein